MKNLLLLLAVFFLLTSCKKDRVDATDTKSFQSSVNDMASELSTIKQIKFNEALYILKTFGVEADGDINELKALGKLLNGKNTQEIFSMADQVAQSNGITWSSTAPPSLGEMNIFGNEKATEIDHNDIAANALSIVVKNSSSDSLSGVKSIQIIPKLVDNAGQPINFVGAALETTLEVFSNGTKLSTAKNLMQDNNFNGFNLKFSSLPASKILDNRIDITVSVKTTKKTYKMSKVGVPVNPKALAKPVVETAPTDEELTDPTLSDPNNPANPTTPTNTPTGTTADPKVVVSKFLNNLSTQNLKAAYDASSNPSWGSYDNFSNPNSGFGTVKSLNVKNISTKNNTDNSATVNATYDVTDKSGRTTALLVTFGLKNVNGEWKISSYKINQ